MALEAFSLYSATRRAGKTCRGGRATFRPPYSEFRAVAREPPTVSARLHLREDVDAPPTSRDD